MPAGISKKLRISSGDEQIQDYTTSELIEINSKHNFINLPLELHLMVLRNFPAIPDEELLVNPLYLEQPKDGLGYLDRFNVTRALSRTCHDLRVFYLPLCWERVQSCMPSEAKIHWSRDFSLQIQTQSEGLLRRSPHLLPLVKAVTVCLTRVESDKSLPLLAELMEHLPNIESIQVPHAHGGMGVVIGEAFKDKHYPSIRSAILPNCAGPMLRCCPEIREVTCVEHDGARLITGLLEGHCNKVEVLRGVTPSATTLGRYAKINPPLRRIRISIQEGSGESIRRFSCFSSLRVIEINCSEEKETHLIPELIQVAKETLRICSTFDPTAKGKSARAKKEAAAARQKLTQVHSEPKLVRVMYLPGPKPRKDYDHEDPSYFYPSRIEEFLL